MHEGLTVDPRTGWDRGPVVGRLSRALHGLAQASIYVITAALFAPLPFAVGIWAVLLLGGGAHVLVLGQEARALARCDGADTSASRQLRWERALVGAVAIGFFGAALLLLGLHVLLEGFGTLPAGLGVVCLAVVPPAVGMSLRGVRLALRHRPGAVGHPRVGFTAD